MTKKIFCLLVVSDVEKYSKTESEKEDDLNTQFYSIANLIHEYNLNEFCHLVDFSSFG